MITFKISFLLSFNLAEEEIKKRDKAGKKKDSKEGSSKASKTKDKVKAKEIVVEVVEIPKHVFEVETIKGVAHIEYELVPNKCKYQVDVICWGPIAKIFTSDGLKTLKTVVKNEKAWVPVCMEHYIDSLELDEVKKLHDYIVDFTIFTTMDKLGSTAKADKSKTFYAYKHEAESSNFCDVFYEDPNTEDWDFEKQKKESIEKYIRNIIMKCVNMPRNDVVSWLHYPENYDQFNEIIEKRSSGISITCKDFVLPCPLLMEIKEVKIKAEQDKKPKATEKRSKTTNESKKSKGKAKEEKAQDNIVKISVPAEVFFTDPFLSIYKTESRGSLQESFVLISVDKLITRPQKLILNALVIKIKKLCDIPVDILKDFGVVSLYTEYCIPNIVDCKSIEKPLGTNIIFNEAHIYFMDKIPKFKLVEFIQTQKLFVEIYGIRQPLPQNIHANLFGKEAGDKEIGKLKLNVKKKLLKNQDNDTLPVLLAVCSFDISSLAENIWDFRESGQCHAPGLTLFQRPCGYYDVVKLVDKMTTIEINMDPQYIRRKHVIEESVLLTLGTALEVEAYLMAPQAPSLIYHHIPNTFKRMILILYQREIAVNILCEILKQNKNILAEATENERLQYLDVITGFMIDNGNQFLFYLEGLSIGFILNVSLVIENVDPDTGKIFFNTDNAFEKRLYTHFLNEGLSLITLKVPLHDILKQPKLYWRGNVPLTCMEALKKLCLLCYSPSYRNILQSNLLPKPQELLSLNIEFGVPLRWKEIKEI